jgi:hypothetical protein
METALVRSQAPVPSVLSDDELLAAIARDLRSIYSEIIKQPLPEKLAAVLGRLELRSSPLASSDCVTARPLSPERVSPGSNISPARELHTRELLLAV